MCLCCTLGRLLKICTNRDNKRRFGIASSISFSKTTATSRVPSDGAANNHHLNGSLDLLFNAQTRVNFPAPKTAALPTGSVFQPSYFVTKRQLGTYFLAAIAACTINEKICDAVCSSKIVAHAINMRLSIVQLCRRCPLSPISCRLA